MSKKTIKLHYHPAMKKVKFSQCEDKDGNWIEFKPPQLLNWISKSDFVLQDQGNNFLNSIVKSLDGAREIEILFSGTYVDFEDFKLMIQFYNENKNEKDDCMFSCKHDSVLIDMGKLYDEVERFGKNAVNKLVERKSSLSLSGESNETKSEFIKAISEYKERISKKIESLNSTDINICFAGTYSAGKSALINAILKCKILPEADESKTAKFCIIKQPAVGKKEGIRFRFLEDSFETAIEWTGKSLKLCQKGSGEYPLRAEIEKSITKNKGKSKEKQFYDVINILNSSEEIDIKIYVDFNISINSSKLSFTIYDTPGTGSNTYAHRTVLEDALKEQSHSILVFVGAVGKLEGEGNSVLLELLNSDNKSRIDVDRSMFVINRADTTTKSKLGDYVTGRNEKGEALTIKICERGISSSQNNDLQEESTHAITEITLTDKKLFFTSASQGSAAMAMKNGTQDEDVEEIWEGIKSYPFFQFNKCGNSEVATKRMIETANTALEKAENEYDKAYIKTGIFSLVNGIVEYGEKYAVATKVNSLITEVENALLELRKKAESLEDRCMQSVEELEAQLKKIKGCISKEIDDEYKRLSPKKTGMIFDVGADAEDLGIDKDSIVDCKKEILQKIEHELKSYSFLGNQLKKNIREDKVNTFKIERIINIETNQFIERFNKSQRQLLKKKQESFKTSIHQIINKNGGLSDAAKTAILDGIDSLDIPPNTNVKEDVNQLIEMAKKEERFWIFWTRTVVDTNEIFSQTKELLDKIIDEKREQFGKTYYDCYKQTIDKVKEKFEKNVESFSKSIIDIEKSKSGILKIAGEIKKMTEELEWFMNELSALIWEEEKV